MIYSIPVSQVRLFILDLATYKGRHIRVFSVLLNDIDFLCRGYLNHFSIGLLIRFQSAVTVEPYHFRSFGLLEALRLRKVMRLLVLFPKSCIICCVASKAKRVNEL